jgi:hypothetical protein
MALAIISAVALAVLVGREISSDAVGVVIGVLCGVVAGVPASMLLLAVASRSLLEEHAVPGRADRVGVDPPVVVIRGEPPQALAGAPGGYSGSSAMSRTLDRQVRLAAQSNASTGDIRYWER